MVKFLGLYDPWSSFLDFSPSVRRRVGASAFGDFGSQLAYVSRVWKSFGLKICFVAVLISISSHMTSILSHATSSLSQVTSEAAR